nr:hypothetical protein [Tanacetum cinerariifolium]
MTSVVSRDILFGTIHIEIPIIPDMPADLPTIPKLPAVSPFLGSDDFESESADESPKRHVSLRLHDDMVSKWRDRVIFRSSSPSGSSSPDTTIPFIEIPTASPGFISTLVIIASPAVRSRIWMTVRKSTLGLQSVMMPARSAALCRAHRALLLLETSSSDTSSRYSSDLALASSSSAGPSRKRSRSSATSITSTIHTTRVLSTTRSNLLPPHKRYRGIEPILVGIEAGYEPGLVVVKTKSESEEVEADKEADAESRPEGTIEIGVDVATRIDTPHEFPAPDAIKRWLPKKPTVTLDFSMKIKAKMEMIMIMEVEEMETMVTIMEMQIKMKGMKVQEEMHQLPGFIPTRISSIINHTSLVAWKELMVWLDGALTWWNSHVHTIGIDEAYAMLWKDLIKLMIEELTLLCPMMVPKENDKIESKKIGYAGSAPYCNKCRFHHEGACIVRCTSCKKGYFKSNGPKLNNQNRGNKAARNDARERDYALGGGDGNPDSNVVTGMFLLNNHYAYILFDSRADRSFVSTTFSALIDIPPTALDVSYVVELADGRIIEFSTIIKDCTLNLLDHL